MNNISRKYYWLALPVWMLILTVSAGTGCSKYEVNSLEQLEEIALAPPEELRKVITQGDFTFTIDYLATEVLLLSEYKYLKELEERKATEQAIAKQKEYITQYRKGYDSSIQFKVTITPVGDYDLIYAKMGNGFDSYSQWLQKLLFGIQEEMYLETKEGEEVPLSNYQMDRNYGTIKSRTFLLSFPIEWNGKQLLEEDQLKLRIDEFGLGTGRITAGFELPLPNIEYKEYSTTTS